MNKKLAPPKATKGDVAHAVVRAGLGAIPLAGSAAVELFQGVVQPPLERRRLKWMEEIGERLEALEAAGLDLNQLSSNEQFVSAVMHASQIALKTHESEKLDALRNAVESVATGQAPEESLQHFFLSLVDELTALHLQILRFFQSPPPSPNIMAGGLSNVLETGLPRLRGQRAIYDQFWKDLYARGLVNTETLHVMMSGAGLGAKRTSELGDLFLAFIASRPSA